MINYWGGQGDHTISGGVGNDMLTGGEGNDILMGDRGSDDINTGNGNDIVIHIKQKSSQTAFLSHLKIEKLFY